MKAMQKKIDGKTVKITASGYLYIQGIRYSSIPCSPLHRHFVDGEIGELISEWNQKNYKMVNN
jgi:hypothetical protein